MIPKNINIELIKDERYINLIKKALEQPVLSKEDINNKDDKDIDNINKLLMINSSVNLKLYVSPSCPNCPHLLQSFLPVVKELSCINLKIIDALSASDEAAEDNIMSVPSLILENGFRFTGRDIKPYDIIDFIVNMVVNQDSSKLSASSLKMMLEEGRADWIAAQMIEYNVMFDSFIELLTHKIWSVRLGAMVVIEDIASKAPELALTIAPGLLNRFNNSDTDIPTKGDILYALGEIGDSWVKDEIIKIIEAVTNEDVIEAGKAALESIDSRGF